MPIFRHYFKSKLPEKKTRPLKSVPEQIAEAAVKIAIANHHMVGFDVDAPMTANDLRAAYQILQDREYTRAMLILRGYAFRTYQVQLDKSV